MENVEYSPRHLCIYQDIDTRKKTLSREKLFHDILEVKLNICITLILILVHVRKYFIHDCGKHKNLKYYKYGIHNIC